MPEVRLVNHRQNAPRRKSGVRPRCHPLSDQLCVNSRRVRFEHGKAHCADLRQLHRRPLDALGSPAASFENRNPANRDDLIGMFPDSTSDDALAAIDAARHAYDSWRLVPAPKRAEILFRAAQLIVERKETFARDMTREMGKVLDETRGDVQEAIDMTYFLAAEGRRMYGQTVPSELPDKFAMSMRQPLGVCSIITPWNFPMAIPSWKIIPALVCGNTVVFKPSELTPLSALNFVRVLEEAGVPAGRGQHGDRRARDRRAVHDAQGRRRRVVHGIDGGRPARQSECRAVLQEGPSRDGRQELHHDHGRRQSRAGARGLSLGRVRHDRAALHGGEPRHRARAGARSVRRAIRRACAGVARRRRPRSEDAGGAVDQREAARKGR